MTTICVFMEDTKEVRERLWKIKREFNCFVRIETVEFDYIQVQVDCPIPQAEAIEKRLTDLV